MTMPSLRGEATLATSLRRTEVQRMGFNTSIFVTRQRMAGFQRMASKTARAAEGVMTS